MTDVALRDYLETLVSELDKRVDMRFIALDASISEAKRVAERAIEKAEAAQLEKAEVGTSARVQNHWVFLAALQVLTAILSIAALFVAFTRGKS